MRLFEKSRGKVGGFIKQKSDDAKDWSELKAKIQKLEKGQFTSKNIREQEDVFKSFTGFHPVKFDILFQFLNPGENAIKRVPLKKSPSAVATSSQSVQ